MNDSDLSNVSDGQTTRIPFPFLVVIIDQGGGRHLRRRGTPRSLCLERSPPVTPFLPSNRLRGLIHNSMHRGAPLLVRGPPAIVSRAIKTLLAGMTVIPAGSLRHHDSPAIMEGKEGANLPPPFLFFCDSAFEGENPQFPSPRLLVNEFVVVLLHGPWYKVISLLSPSLQPSLPSLGCENRDTF